MKTVKLIQTLGAYKESYTENVRCDGNAYAEYDYTKDYEYGTHYHYIFHLTKGVNGDIAIGKWIFSAIIKGTHSTYKNQDDWFRFEIPCITAEGEEELISISGVDIKKFTLLEIIFNTMNVVAILDDLQLATRCVSSIFLTSKPNFSKKEDALKSFVEFEEFRNKLEVIFKEKEHLNPPFIQFLNRRLNLRQKDYLNLIEKLE